MTRAIPSDCGASLKRAKRHPQFAVISAEIITVYGTGRPVWPALEADGPEPVNDITKALALSNPICHSSVIMRRPAIVGLGGYEEGRRFVLDYDLWVRCAAAGLRLGKLQMPLAAKRIHPGQYFLHTARLRYLLASLRVQARGMRTVRAQPWQVPVIALRMGWLILPLSIRHAIGRFRESRRMVNHGRR